MVSHCICGCVESESESSRWCDGRVMRCFGPVLEQNTVDTRMLRSVNIRLAALDLMFMCCTIVAVALHARCW